MGARHFRNDEAASPRIEINLAANENPFGPSPAALRVLRDKGKFTHLYPDNRNLELRTVLASRLGLRQDEVLVTAGSTAFLEIIARCALGPGLRAITSERSFIAYDIVTQSAGCGLHKVPMRANSFDLDA